MMRVEGIHCRSRHRKETIKHYMHVYIWYMYRNCHPIPIKTSAYAIKADFSNSLIREIFTSSTSGIWLLQVPSCMCKEWSTSVCRWSHFCFCAFFFLKFKVLVTCSQTLCSLLPRSHHWWRKLVLVILQCSFESFPKLRLISVAYVKGTQPGKGLLTLLGSHHHQIHVSIRSHIRVRNDTFIQLYHTSERTLSSEKK